MAYIVDYATQFFTAGTALVFPAHQTDDILLVFATADTSAASTLAATWGGNSTGAVTISANATNAGIATFISSAKATGTAATCTLATADSTHVHILVIRDADTTTWLDAARTTSANASATTVTANAYTTTTQDCLVIYYLGIDANTTTVTQAHSQPGPAATMMFLDSSDNGSATTTTMAGAAIGWYMQRATGAVPQPIWDLAASEVTTSITFAIRNNSGGRIPAYVDDSSSLGRRLISGMHISATDRNNQLFPVALSYANIGPAATGQPTTFDAAALVVDSGFNPYSSALNSTPATSTTNQIGFQVNFTSVYDMTNGWIVGGFQASTSKMALYNQGSLQQGGGWLTIGQGANFRSYKVMGRDNQDGAGAGFAIISVQANQEQTRSGYSTTAPTITSIDKILITNRGQNATGAFYYTDFHLINKVILAGGDANNPVGSQGVADIGKFCRVPLIKKLGASELTAYVPVQVGGGDAINFQIDAGAFQFPRIANETAKEVNYHGANGAIGISYAGKSGDVIKHTNSVVTSASPYYWEINSAATSAATWDFTGITIVNANVTLRPVMTFTNMAFSSCAFIDTNGSTIQSCKFNNSLVRVSSPANASLISQCTFSKTTGTQHAIEITGTAANVSLSGVSFTGYASTNGSTGNEAIYVNIATGSVTINISGGGSTPTIRTAGATVNVVSGATVTFTGLPTGTDIVILTAGTSTILQQVDSYGSASYPYSYSGTPTVDVGFIKTGYVPYYIRGLALGSTDSSIPVSMTLDRNFI